MTFSVPINFLRDPVSGRSAQEEFCNVTKRHSCFSGGYGNGKSYAASIKALILLSNFPKYRVAICRFSTTDLKRSTMSTFFKVCPPELYDPKHGGNRADSLNYLKLINGSEVFWMHLDDADENTVRGLEVNSVVVDQAEEISENMYNHLSARVGRWDIAEVPAEKLAANPDWPHKCRTCGLSGIKLNSPCCVNPRHHPQVPNYMMILCNPDSELHWIYRRYHPESIEWAEKFTADYEMVQASSTENPTLDPATLRDMMQNDPVWVQRFVFGKWGIPGGAIHEVPRESILVPGVDISHEFINTIIKSGNLFRVLDHGDASPTACMWFSAYKDWFFAYREYYKPGLLVSDHRKNIAEMSVDPSGIPEFYKANWADPQIFKKSQQKYGGFWSTAEEYLDKAIEAPIIHFLPADNNELSTRNRISEYFRRSPSLRHPSTGQSPSPKFYFIQRTEDYPHGCYRAILETKGQKRKQVGTIDGKPVFSDERDDGIPDHAYDCVRYFVAMHPYSPRHLKINAPSGSFFDVRKQMLVLRESEKYKTQDIRLGKY